MKTENNILIAFILNLVFSIFEFIGGIFTGSVAIISDAIHDFGDVFSIGISFFLEKKSKKQPDEKYTYGYGRYSVIGSVIIYLILIFSSVLVIYNAIIKIINPTKIDYNGMIIFAIVGVIVNLCATIFTHHGNSLNQKAVNLHMIEDVLGWVVVLVGAVIIKFTSFYIIDPLMSIGVSIFILINAIKNFKEALEIVAEKVPHGIDVDEIKSHICKINGIIDVHHIHIWSITEDKNYATMHVITSEDTHKIKNTVRKELMNFGINHVTLELELCGETCNEQNCTFDFKFSHSHHH